MISHDGTIEPSSIYPPTQPATPLPSSTRTRFKVQLMDQSKSPDSLPYPLPILAPPPYVDIPRAPVNEEEIAEARIAMMMNKDEDERKADGLVNVVCVDRSSSSPTIKREDTPSCDADELDDDMDEDERELWRAVGEEIDIECDKTLPTTAHEDCKECKDQEDAFHWPLLSQLCIDEDFRQEAVEWILDVCISHLFYLRALPE